MDDETRAQIIYLIKQGRDNAAIAEALHIKAGSVENVRRGYNRKEAAEKERLAEVLKYMRVIAPPRENPFKRFIHKIFGKSK